MNRHLVRSIILQTLFECDFSQAKNPDLRGILEHNIFSFNDTSAPDYIIDEMKNTLLEIKDKQVTLDEIIAKAAPEWPIDQIAIVDRNILRLGIYELLFADHDKIPQKVAINEAVELAKEFGSDTSSKFINGVIGAVYREIGDPGKEQESPASLKKKKAREEGKKKETEKLAKKEEIPVEKKVGAVIYSKDKDNTIRLCFVHDIFGHWTLVKGGDEEDSTEDALVNIVKAKIGLDILVEKKIGENEYPTHHPEKKDVIRKVEYFLAKSDYTDPKLAEGLTGLGDVKWFELGEITDLNLYDDITKIVIKSIEIISK